MLTWLVRTIVPLIVGVIITKAAQVGFDLPEAAVTDVTVAIVSGAYAVAARLLERYVSPKFGWLFGIAKEPVYDPQHA
jgi:hypothetical protein